MIFGYCRVSSKSQIDNNSLEQQKQEILKKYPNAADIAELVQRVRLITIVWNSKNKRY